jgi:hypothetical protein
VKEPFLWPNSSLSTRDSGRAEMLTVMKGLSARYQHRRLARRAARRDLQDAHDLPAAEDDRARVECLLDLLADCALLPVEGERFVHPHEQVGNVRLARGLDEVVVGSGLEDLDGVPRALEGRHDNDPDLGVDLLDPLQHLQAVHVGQAEVRQHEVDLSAGEGREPFLARLRGLARNLRVLLGAADRVEQGELGRIVVDKEDV